MKTTATPANEHPYPCLKSSGEERIILFTGPNEGTLVHGDKPCEIGFYSENWNEAEFSPYTGTVTLEN